LPGQSSRVLTQEQKYVQVDYYIKWRIKNFALYYQRTKGNANNAKALLDPPINGALRAAFGKRTITEMVSGQREDVMALLKNSANEAAKELGIEVNDVRIKAIDLPDEVTETVYVRMRTKREQVATQHRSRGQAQAEAIRAKADADAAVQVSQAQETGAKMRAQGTTEAASLYSKAYGSDPDFYAFYRSLEIYKNSFNSRKDVLLLTPENGFFQYFNNPPAKSQK